MDIVTLLILMALFYLVPELLKRRRPKTYEYPQIPDRVPMPETVPPPAPGKADETPAVPYAYAAESAAPFQPEVRPGESKVPGPAEGTLGPLRLDQAEVVNGIIYAEILQPPRALRPMRRRGR